MVHSKVSIYQDQGENLTFFYICFYSTSWYISLIILLVVKLFSEHFTHTGCGGMVEGAGIFPEWEE